MKNKKWLLSMLVCMGVGFLLPEIGFCSVESSLAAMQTKLTNVILPLVAMLGLVFAGLSFAMGNPNARQHLILAMVGAAVGFGAQGIISLIRGMVN